MRRFTIRSCVRLASLALVLVGVPTVNAGIFPLMFFDEREAAQQSYPSAFDSPATDTSRGVGESPLPGLASAGGTGAGLADLAIQELDGMGQSGDQALSLDSALPSGSAFDVLSAATDEPNPGLFEPLEPEFPSDPSFTETGLPNDLMSPFSPLGSDSPLSSLAPVPATDLPSLSSLPGPSAEPRGLFQPTWSGSFGEGESGWGEGEAPGSQGDRLVTPEPASLIIWALGAAGLLFYARRRAVRR